MRTRSLFLPILLAILPAGLSAQASAKPLHPALKAERPGLLAKATVADSTARHSALARVSGGTIVEAELEEEHGKLIYSYDVRVKGKPGIDEVAVDARTGAVLSVEHESAADEAKEAKADSAAPRP